MMQYKDKMFNKKNIILFAAGGGNDVFSTLAYNKAFISKYKFEKIALVSVLGLTPFHNNEVVKPGILNIEEPLIKPSREMHRYLTFNSSDTNNPKEIYNMEKLLPDLVDEFTPEIENYICMSPKYSAKEQADNLRKLFIKWEMCSETTLLNIVDFGGDILTDGRQSSIISPELDAYTLAVVGNLNEYLSKICVCFPGVDGELYPEYLSEKCSDSVKYDVNDDEWIDVLGKIYDRLKDKRPGNTIPNMLNVLKGEKCSLSKKWVVGKKPYSFKKETILDSELQRSIHMFDMIYYTLNPYVQIFNSEDYDLVKVISYIMKIYDSQVKDENTFQSTDFHLQYIRKDLNDMWTGKHLLYENDIKQLTMMIDLVPYVISKDKETIAEDIENLKGYDILYSNFIKE